MIDIQATYDVKLDEKNRFPLPAAFRKQLPEGFVEQFVISCGFDKCLYFNTVENWTKIKANLDTLNDTINEQRRLKRLLKKGAVVVTPDSTGRISLSPTLKEHSGISKEILFIAEGLRVEIWDKSTYLRLTSEDSNNYESLAETVSDQTNGTFNPFNIS